jgi:hypothetical protein
MSLDEYANTQCVVCEHCASELRVWYTPDHLAPPSQYAECPACRKGIPLDLRATIESVEVMRAAESFWSGKSSDRSQRRRDGIRGVASALWDVFAKTIANNKRRKDI